MLEAVSLAIIQLIQTTGYLGIFSLMMFSAVLIPIPSEITMPFSGFLASSGTFNFFAVILVGAFGDLIGSLIGYGIGFYLEENVLLTLIRRYGKFFLVSEHEFEKARKWFNKYGTKIVFISKFIPGIRTYIALPAGIAKMNIWKFSTYAFLGTLIWTSFLTFVGYYLGNNWQLFGGIFRKFEIVILVLIIFMALFYINYKLKIIKFKK